MGGDGGFVGVVGFVMRCGGVAVLWCVVGVEMEGGFGVVWCGGGEDCLDGWMVGWLVGWIVGGDA